MLFRLMLIAGFFLLLPGSLSAQQNSSVSEAQKLISKQSLKNTMVSLTDPLLKGRESGTEEIKRGLEVIADA